MEILFLSYCYKKIHYLVLKEMIACLERNNYKVSMQFDESVTYDCILIFNKKELMKHKKVLTTVKMPVIYLFCMSDIVKEYPVLTCITKIIALKDKILNSQHLSLISLIQQEMILPAKQDELNVHKQTACIQRDNRTLIYVNIDDEYFKGLTFLKLLPLLNYLHEYEIIYQSPQGIGREFINKHIRLISSKYNSEDCIDQANIVIASGYTAYRSVLKGKKTIVAGEKGYGGLVTADNLGYHLANFFQGRNGGKFDESIPFPLMENAIKTDMPDVGELQKKLLYLQNQNQGIWIQLIQTITYYARKGKPDLTVSYILNPDYYLEKINKRIWLSKRIFRTMYKSVNESESTVINAFQQAHTIRDILDMFPSEYEEDIKEYIWELIGQKILIPIELSFINTSYR